MLTFIATTLADKHNYLDNNACIIANTRDRLQIQNGECMKNHKTLVFVAMFVAIGLPLLLPDIALAQTAGDIGQVENFIRNVIRAVAGLAGLIATGFFVVGGFGYITSSGNPENLEKSKSTLKYSAIGLAITVGAFVLSNIVTQLATDAFGA